MIHGYWIQVPITKEPKKGYSGKVEIKAMQKDK